MSNWRKLFGLGDAPDHSAGTRNIGRVLQTMEARPSFQALRQSIADDLASKQAAREAARPAKPSTYESHGKIYQRGGGYIKDAPLEADCSDSVCFESLVWEDGEVTAVFARNGAEYTYPMSRAEAKEWFDDDLGEYFNDEIREDTSNA